MYLEVFHSKVWSGSLEAKVYLEHLTRVCNPFGEVRLPSQALLNWQQIKYVGYFQSQTQCLQLEPFKKICCPDIT